MYDIAEGSSLMLPYKQVPNGKSVRHSAWLSCRISQDFVGYSVSVLESAAPFERMESHKEENRKKDQI